MGIAVIGAGAVGQMLAFYLQKFSGKSVLLIGRSGESLAVKTQISWQNGKEEFTSKLSTDSPLKTYFFTMKSYDLAQALEHWATVAPPGSTFILLMNGYIEPVVAPFRTRRPDIFWRKGTVTKGSRWEAPEHLVLSAEGDLIWGHSDQQPQPEEALVLKQLAPYGFQWSASACGHRRDKWYFNTVLNTLTGARSLDRNGDALNCPDLEKLALEVEAIGSLLWPDWNTKGLFQRLKDLIMKTRDNENSMRRDLRLGRKTEAEFLSGLVLGLKSAERLYPLLYALHQNVIAKERTQS